jgi:hypothetical protein
MKIPKIFGNKIVVLVIALALIIVVLVSLINISKIALTGFSSLNEGEQEIQESTISDSTNQGSAMSINIFEENPLGLEDVYLIEENTEIPQETTKKSSRRSSSNSNSQINTNSGNNNNEKNPSENNNGNDDNNGQENNNGNNNPPITSKNKLTKKSKDLNLKKDEVEINEGEEFQGVVRLTLEKSNKKISTFNINFDEDIDLSDVIGDSDFITGKSFMHSTSGFLENIDLYVPIKEGMDGIVVCSNADSYDEIYYGCSENPSITKEELLVLPHPRVEISEDNLYFIVHGITGTGAMGVNVTNISSSHQNATPPGSLDAVAGNITEITTPEGWGITQAWAGYYGNVSGAIQLADSGNNILYNWTLSSPEGEVFASTNDSISWNDVQCFNFTSSGTYIDESGNGGTTNSHGTNITILETQYGIENNDLDGVDETFYLLGVGTHNTFYVNANEFIEGECPNTRIFDSSGSGNDDNFEEILLYEPTTSSVIFASLLNEDLPGFDSNPHDFEMIVLEDGHLTDTSTTLYYFYAVMY